ncbi:MAG: hypothetical protein KBB50_01135, partial [Candidatus Pacebacteria bacterium]|nr:hypothetical protein [Candidatus Paceibacterota bacterium]
FNIPEISELTDEQKNKAIQNLFEYAKKNPNMSMFNQINTFSSKDVIQPGEKLDLQMIKQLLTFPIDSLNNKSIIEYTKELS